MRIGGFSLFQKTNVRRYWCIASWHSPHSITWRWSISLSLGSRGGRLWWKLPKGAGVDVGVRIPFVAELRVETQQPMWYRDCYRRAQSDLDRAQRSTGVRF